jgi:hypothetical protein
MSRLARFASGIKYALGYDAGEANRMRKDLGWARATPRDEDSLVDDGTRELIRQKAADLRRNNPIIAGIGNRIASFCCPLLPQAQTTDPTWNTAAENFWTQQYSGVCDSRQRATLFDLQWLATSIRPTHGGLYLELLDNGQVRPIECERIRQPQDHKEAEDYVDGVKVDRKSGVILGYKVHARSKDGTFGAKHEERFVPREQIIPMTTPAWRPDMVREIADLAAIVPAFQDVHEANKHQLNTFKVQSSIIGALKKLGGAGSNSLPRGSTSPTPGQRQTFKTEWGQIMEMFPGEDLDLKVSPTPGAQHIPYMKWQILLAGTALDFPYEFWTLDFSTADFSRQKAIMRMVYKTIQRAWVPWLGQKMQRLWNWRIAKAIANGELPPAPVEKGPNGFDRSQWFKVEWHAPEEIVTDRQEANQADLMEYQLAITPLSMIVKRRGHLSFEDRLRMKAADDAVIERVAAETGVPRARLVKDIMIPGQQSNTTPPQDAPPKKEPKNATDDE